MIESLSLIDAVMPDVVASRQQQALKQKSDVVENNQEENTKHPYCTKFLLGLMSNFGQLTYREMFDFIVTNSYYGHNGREYGRRLDNKYS